MLKEDSNGGKMAIFKNPRNSFLAIQLTPNLFLDILILLVFYI